METKINKIEEITSVNGVSVETKELISAAFNPFASQINEWKEKATELKVTSIEQTKEMSLAREARLALQKVRTGADKKRKELKEESNRYNKAVQEVYNWIESEIKPIEEYLELQEKFKEVQEAKMKSERLVERQKELSKWGYADNFSDLLNMPEDTYITFKTGVEAAYNARIEAERKAEEEAKAEALRIKLHNQRKEMALPYYQFWSDFEKDLNFGEQSENDFNAFMERNKKAKAEHEAAMEAQRLENERLKKEAEKREAEIEAERKKQAAEKARIEAEQAAKLKKEQEEKAALEAELKAKRDAEVKAEQERLAAEAAAKKEAEKLAKAPVKKQLTAWVDTFALPDTSVENELKQDIVTKFEAYKNWAKTEIEKL